MFEVKVTSTTKEIMETQWDPGATQATSLCHIRLLFDSVYKSRGFSLNFCMVMVYGFVLCIVSGMLLSQVTFLQESLVRSGGPNLSGN